MKSQASRSVWIGGVSFGIIMLIIYGIIIAEIFWDIPQKVILILAAISIIPILMFFGYNINPQNKKSEKMIKCIITLLIIEALVISPYHIILYIESII